MAPEPDAADPDTAPRPLELAVVVPTFNEALNVLPLVEAIRNALAGCEFEIIFVDDDSPDGTADIVRGLAAADRRIRCLQRIGRHGVASAAIEGFLATAAPFAALIDGDLQHDERLLPRMLERLKAGDCDIVAGSRYLRDGDLGDWEKGRARASHLATGLARTLTGVRASDPMSGFFMASTRLLRELSPRLSGSGFKILLDILTVAPASLRYVELPYTFRRRTAGQSSMDLAVAIDFVELLIARTLGRILPTKFVMFALVGSLGVLVHMTVLAACFKGLSAGLAPSQAIAGAVAMIANYSINNVFTHRDKRLAGWHWLPGLMRFALACSVGLLASVAVAQYLFEVAGTPWYVAGIGGIVTGSVWNYTTTARHTWRRS